MPRVMITGCGVFVPGGKNLDCFWKTLCSGRSQASRIACFDPTGFPTQIACQIAEYDPLEYFTPKEVRRSDRYAQFAVIASTQAFSDAKVTSALIEERNRFIGVYEGSSLGPTGWFLDQHTIFLEKGYKRANPLTLAIGFPGAASARVSTTFGIRGPSAASTGGSVASVMALSSAFNALRVGELELALVVGSEAPIYPAILASFCTVSIMSKRNSEPSRAVRPFDRDRDGFILGEGAAAVVLETEASAKHRGVRPYAELRSIGIASDNYHVTSPNPSGIAISTAMNAALRAGECGPEMLDHINAHGTATIHNDAVEASAIAATLGQHASSVPVTSVKGTIGHLLGACGVVELVASALTLRTQEVPPTANFAQLGEGVVMNIVSTKPYRSHIRNVLSNNASFGGKNTSILISDVVDTEG